MKIRAASMVVVLSLLVCMVGADEAGLTEECSNDFQQVVACLDFATGKAAAPSKACCQSIQSMKDSKPECLCFVIQQTHKGSQQIKNLGLQEVKLLQLPSACNLKNSSVSNCPKLLGLSPTSPDAAIFTNSSSPAAPATATTPTGSSGIMIVPQYPSGLIAMAIAVFFTALPASHSGFHA